MAQDLLKELANFLFYTAVQGVAILPPDFNHARLICLPKKAAGTHEEFGDFYTCENTRPLSV
eukprot:1504258-Prorocentrum_lima.AAC.1